MTSEIVQGKAAWARLKQGSRSWDDWSTGRSRAAGRPRHRDAERGHHQPGRPRLFRRFQ